MFKTLCTLRIPLCAGALLGLACATSAVAQQPTFVVADVNATSVSPTSDPGDFVRAGDYVYFAATTPHQGRELYATQGVYEDPSNTFLVSDILPGSGSSTPEDLTALGNLLFFSATDGVRGRELWMSDGTAAGTRLVRDIHPAGGSSPGSFAVHAGVLYFAANDGSSGDELWKSDGTANGTALVRDIRIGPGSSFPEQLVSSPNGLFFAAQDLSTGRELWMSDGTSAGTRLVHDIAPGAGSSYPLHLVSFGSRVVFVADEGVYGREPWSSDGQPGGTVLLRPRTPPSPSWSIPTFTRASDAVYFFPNPTTLWKTDGTPAGTVLVANPSFGTAEDVTALGSTLLFSARNPWGSGTVLWRSDSVSGTVAVTSGWRNWGISSLTPVGSVAWFSGAMSGTSSYMDGLWKTDGTASGTLHVSHIRRYVEALPRGFTECANGRVVFSAEDGEHGREPWVTDGTETGTKLLKDIGIDPRYTRSSGPREAVDVLGTVYFTADDGIHGDELWKSDGTALGTQLVLDIYPGRETSFARDLTRVGQQIFFSADDGVHGRELWVSDGTAAGTRLVVDLYLGPGGSNIDHATAYRGSIYFEAGDGVTGGSLWRSDGTAAGTQPLLYDVTVAHLRAAGDKLWFAGFERVHGIELWCSDGTPGGTFLVADIDPTTNLAGSSPADFVEWGGYVYFIASHPNSGSHNLWRTDGTTAGTQLAAVLPSGIHALNTLTPVATQLFFHRSDLSGHHYLWRSDGTTGGTHRVTPRVRMISKHVPIGDRVLVHAREATQEGLWISDGTDSGTILVRYLSIAASPNPRVLTPIGTRRVTFAATDGVSGYEPWITDGTTSGTQRIADIASVPSSASSNPHHFTLSRGRVLFSADDGIIGDEIWGHFSGATAQRFGDGCAPSGAAPALAGTDPVLGQITSLHGTEVPPGSLAYLLFSSPPASPLDLSGCSLYVDPAAVLIVSGFAASAPDWTLSVNVPNEALLAEQRVLVQTFYALQSGGFSLTNAVALSFGS